MELAMVVKPRKRVLLRTKDRMAWYVVAVEYELENFVQGQIRRAGFDTAIPLLMKKYSNGTVSIRPLLPGYVFVRFNVTDIKWRGLLRFQGVTSILGWGETPAPVHTKDLRRLMEASVMTDKHPEPVLLPGNLVQICDGSTMDGFDAHVVALDGQRVKVSFMLFGKLTEHVFRLDEVRRLT